MKRWIQYKEVQQFRQSWLWYLLISSTVISMLIVLVVAIADKTTTLPEGIAVTAIVLLINGINLIAFYVTKLEVNMTDEGIAYRWWPFFRKFSMINWSDVDYVQIRKYSAFRYGYHSTKELGKVHNVDGVYGYQIVLLNGKKYFFGTQQRLSVENVLRQSGKLKASTQ